MPEALFYVQNTQIQVEKCVLWWKDNDCGYTADLVEARAFTRAEIKARIPILPELALIIWQKEIVDALIEHHIAGRKLKQFTGVPVHNFS